MAHDRAESEVIDQTDQRSVAQLERRWRRAERLARRLARERETLEAIMESTNAQIAYLDADFNFLRVNAAYARSCAKTKAELIGKNHFVLFPDAENRAIFERVRDTGEPVAFDAKPFVFPERPELGITYWDWTLRPIKDEDDKVQRLVLSLTDVTDRERAQKSLQEHADRLRALHRIDQAILAAESKEAIAEAALAHLSPVMEVAHADVLLFDFDAGELSILASHSSHSDTVAAKGWRAPLDGDWPAQIRRLREGRAILIEDLWALDGQDMLLGVLKAEGVRALIRQPLRYGGELVGVLELGRRAAGSVPPRLMALSRELADQLAIALQQAHLHEEIQDYAERLERRVAWRTAALRISEARFRAIFEDAPMGIALLDQRGRVIQNNLALQRILATDETAIHEQPLSHLMAEEDAAAERERYEALMQGGNEGYKAEVRFTHPENQMIWCTVTVSLVRDAGSRPRLAIAMVEDITEKRAAQTAMVQTEKLALTGQLATSLAHEINNPLQTVIGCLGLADEELGSDESVRVYLTMASEELKRAASIVGRLRDLNRPSEPDEREPTRVAELVDRVLAITEKQLRDRGITVEVMEGDNLPTVHVVPDRIQQVFLNLILNAIDAMTRGGELEITCSGTEVPRGCQIVFQDTGIGIPPDVQKNLFSPFHTTKPDGLGLGLFISQNIIEDHGGRIEVRSRPGEGTAFKIWLPSS
ncbi:MAG: PAS domain S-box protein [Anaerolineae bacterium]|nr:PAS domain S-box protein [Anaerolineae bacterium]